MLSSICYKKKIARLTNLIILMLLLFALPAIAQNSQQIQQSKPEIVINGNPLPPTAILGYTGSDWAVKATQFLSLSGAVLSVMNNRM